MFEIDSDMTLHITRGDVAFFTVTAEKNEGLHKFQPNDVVRIKVMQRKNCDNVAFHKDFLVLEEKDTVDIILTENETKIGDTINKPVDYWYEVELNPYTNPQTLIGYDADGPKIFKLYPEGRDLGSGLEPEEIPPVDKELSLTSERPIQNQAVARALIGYDERVILAEQRIESTAKDAEQTVKTNTDNMVENAKAEVEEMTKVVEEAAERVETIAGADLVGIIDGTTQVGNAKTLDGHGAEYFAKDADLANYVPLDGSKPITGNVFRWMNGHSGVTGSYVHTALVSWNDNNSTDSDGIAVVLYNGTDPYSPNKLLCQIKKNGVATNYDILHTGNKPTGSYTGNGDASNFRLVATGGIGDGCIVRSSNGIAIVTVACVSILSGNSSVTDNSATWQNGELGMFSNHPSLNASGVTYTYHVI